MTKIINKLLNQLADEIDITDSQHGAIKRAYNSVADWLNQQNTKIAKHDIDIFPQGSMMYGTAIKPIEEDDYDVDLVCKFTKGTSGLSPAYVKQSVGERLSENLTYRGLLEKEGRRCWTLQYSDNLNFHMDILPAIPFHEEYRSNARFNAIYESMNTARELALLATDKNKVTQEYCFIPTNPRGYAEWFRSRIHFNRTQRACESVERLPEYPYKTVLQKSIQLLKRHRDVFFQDQDEDLKPISMIITTLVAKCYNGETEIYDFICKALNQMPSFIERDDAGKYVIKNPVMPLENFADKWAEKPSKARVFFNWSKQATEDFKNLSQITTYSGFEKELKRLFAQKPVDRLMESYRNQLQQEREVAATCAVVEKSPLVVLVEKIPHRITPPWKLPHGYRVQIQGKVSYDNGANYKTFASGMPLPKGVDLQFFPIHSIKPPYSVKWQITNTGEDARRAGCLRGAEFENSQLSGYGGQITGKKETTAYKGTHYVQCFIIQHGNQCVGVSEPFVVKVQ